MADRKDYKFTHHLRERYLERTRKKFKHLHTCQEEGCQHCRDLVMEIRETLRNRRALDQEIAERLNRAIVCRACLNDSQFMSWYYDKYGTDMKFEFLADDDICFVAIHDEGKKVIVTCVWTKSHKATRQVLRPKFRKKKDAVSL